jgi:hypothetical protein
MRHSRITGREGQGTGQMSNQRGMVMMVAMILMTGLIFIAATSAIRSNRSTQLTAVEMDNLRTFYATEGAVEWGSGELRDLLTTTMDPTQAQLDALAPPALSGFNVETFQITKVGGLTDELLSSGDYKGLHGYVQRYTVHATVASNRRASEVEREIQHQFIPLFQFGVFYEKDLEIIPGPAMTFTGPIHTNGNLYMSCETSINCQSTVTAVGRYWHYRKESPTTDPPGSVNIKDKFGVWKNVWRGSYWLDNRQPTWGVDALSLWGGNFRDASHGLTPLRLPLPPAADQHVAIERSLVGDTQLERDAKYWYKASIRWVDGNLTNAAGVPLVQPNVYTYTPDKFYDQRENKWVDCLDINIGTMIAGGFAPPNGIIYVSHNNGNAPVVRILNAATLPAGGLTIATNLPMYVKGNYNTVAKKGSSLLSDALTLLSPSWNDANSNSAMSTVRIAGDMTINACIMTGHVGTVGANYSGGLENNFRFLENWSGKNCTFNGSIIDLWYSQFATARWITTGTYYNAPNRIWGYDNDLVSPANWPPGAPRVHTVQRGIWRQIS